MGVVIVERGWGVAGGRVVIVVIAIRVMTVVGFVRAEVKGAGRYLVKGDGRQASLTCFGQD
jgi:hypothetical protein